MATVNIKNYNVQFPYETPYELQKVYMEKMITCLDEQRHGVLESPTGTGKTLCLFAPVATWMKYQKHNQPSSQDQQSFFDEVQNMVEKGQIPPTSSESWTRSKRVWYTSRTHSQIAQAVAELRRCDIQGLKIRVLGARDQLCIHPEVLAEKESYVKTIKCKEMIKEKLQGGCRFYKKGKFEELSKNFYGDGEVMDIEDLVQAGKKCGVCPYYMSKDASKDADIILLPYNYIIDKDAREGNGFTFNKDIIIFDEGHNVPSSCEESYEFQLTSVDLALGAEHVRQLMEHLCLRVEMAKDEEDEMFVQTHANYCQFIMQILIRLQAALEKMSLSTELLPISTLHDFFKQAGVTNESTREILDALESFKSNATQLNLHGNILSIFYLLEKAVSVMFGPVVSLFDVKSIEQSFKVLITKDADRAAESKKVALYCFNPSFGIKTLLQLGVQSIIITSGTLSPLNTLIRELGLPEPITLENGHIAKKCQVPFVILGTGVGNQRMDGSFKNRNKPEYIFSLGNTLTNLISSVPDGVLLLFSSYSMMNNLKESWESNNGIWARLNTLKRVFIEPRGKEEFITCMENYKRAIDSGNGAILMGVLRGKISEGMDFKDQYCRGVFIIGVPFPPVQDPRVKGKEKYAESLTYTDPKTNRVERLYSNSFLSVEAMKATNQAIGRVIRHGQDYGAVVLVDYRFTSPRLFFNISSWLRGPKPVEKNFMETKKHLREFFRDIHNGKLGITEIRHQRVDANGCPIAGNVHYEEYVYKKHTPAPNITFQTANRNKKGKAVIDYMDDEDDKPDILSAYMSQDNDANMQSQSSYFSTQTKSSSLLGALEASRSSSVGYREFDPSDLLKESSENSKRKFVQDGDLKGQNVKSPRMEKKSLKLFSKIQIQPLSPSEAQEPENVFPSDTNKLNIVGFDYLASLTRTGPTPNSNVTGSRDHHGQLVKDYFYLVKSSVSKDVYSKFVSAWAAYGRSQGQLTDVIRVLKEIVVSSNQTNLFKGFEVCVKGNDKEQWFQILKNNTF